MDHTERTSFPPASLPQASKQRNPFATPPFTNPRENPLQSLRIIQPDLVYIINLPETLANEPLLRSYEYFGHFGSITKCMINKNSIYHGPSGTPSYGVYITFSKEEDAALCIKACNDFVLQGHTLNATYGTTKYCSFFIQKKPCPKPNCLFLHYYANTQNTIARDGLAVKKHIQPDNATIDKLQIQVLPLDGTTQLPVARAVRKRIQSEQFNLGIPIGVRGRLLSKDMSPPLKSRFSFVEDNCEEALSVPEYFYEISNLASPSKPTAELSSSHLERMMSSCSPDLWALDLMEVAPRRLSDLTTNSDDDLVVILTKSN